MKDFFLKIWGLLNRKEKFLTLVFVGLTILAALMELVGVFSIIPFIGVLTNPETIQENSVYSFFYVYFDFQSTQDFLVFLGFLTVGILFLSSIFLSFFQWFNFRFLFKLGSKLTVTLYKIYISQNYSFHLNRNSSELTKNIFAEMGRFVQGVLIPCNLIVSRSIVVILLAGMIFISEPKIAIILALTLGTTYAFIFSFFKRKLDASAKKGFQFRDKAFKLANETFWTIKELKLYGMEESFTSDFDRVYYKSFKPDADHSTASAVPRYLVEFVTFSSVVFIMLYLMNVSSNFVDAIPLLSLFAFSAFKMLPYLQQIYQAFLSIRFSLPTIHALSKDISLQPGRIKTQIDLNDRINLQKRIELKSVSFSYEGSPRKILKDIDLSIQAKSVVGIIGKTGEGKTTLVDIILGLLKPTNGYLLVDGKKIENEDIDRWSASVGYVPQQIVLWDDTIARNIAFTAPEESIDMNKVMKAAEAANLAQFVLNDLPEAFETKVGERGVKLSGGQRQRIGIARAIYRDPEILVFDEATSALDLETEKVVMEAIDGLGGKKTILIIAHRLATLERCDHVFKVSAGSLLLER